MCQVCFTPSYLCSGSSLHQEWPSLLVYVLISQIGSSWRSPLHLSGPRWPHQSLHCTQQMSAIIPLTLIYSAVYMSVSIHGFVGSHWAKTTRNQKHIHELIKIKREWHFPIGERTRSLKPCAYHNCSTHTFTDYGIQFYTR